MHGMKSEYSRLERLIKLNVKTHDQALTCLVYLVVNEKVNVSEML